MTDQHVYIERAAMYAATHSYNVVTVSDCKVVFTGSWRECYEQARDLDSQFRAAYGGSQEKTPETKLDHVKLNRVERSKLLDIGRAAGDMESAADAMFTELCSREEWEHLEAVVISDYTWAAAKFCYPQEARYW